MPLMKGKSREVVSKNIKEMVASGRPVKQAIAAALSMKHKSAKMMAHGGEIEDDNYGMDGIRSMGELNIEGQSHPNSVASPEEESEDMMLAKALHSKAEEGEMEEYAMGGEVEVQEDGMDGNMPKEEMAASPGEPMSSEPMKPEGKMDFSEAAKRAIEEKRKNRRYMA